MSGKSDNLSLDSAEDCHCWIIAFEAHCRTKEIEDKLGTSGTSPQTDRFLERCGPKALLKLVAMMPGQNIEKSLFQDIKKTIFDYVEPRKRLFVADRTNFLQISQNGDESEVDFLSRLNESAQHCHWDQLKSSNPSEE